jgi:hypothetical protein
MCRAVRCQTCGRTTWAGCGQHVEQVRASVPAEAWCPGHNDKPATPPAASATTGRRGWLRGLRGR